MITRDTIRLPFNSSLASALKRCVREDHGQSLIEGALSMLVVLMFVFGVIELSMAMYNFHYLANSAHEAARYAIVRGSSWGTPCDSNGTVGSGYGSSQCTASTTDIANYVTNRGYPGISIAANNVCVQYYSSVPSKSSTNCTTSSGTLSNDPGDVVEVRIRVPYQIALPGLPTYTWNLQSTSLMVIAQ